MFFMKFVVSAEQRRFFREHGYIEFDELLSQESLKEASEAAGKVLSLRTGAKGGALKQLAHADVYPYARNLWMDSDNIKKFDCQGRLSEIALSLAEKKELILGYDQLLLPELSSYNSYYSTIFPEALPLSDLSSVQGISCAMIVCLEGSGEMGLFPAVAGNVTFVSPKTTVDFSVLKENFDKKYFLIVFADMNSVYFLKENDPNTHFNKQRGYVFGDRLAKKGHPTIRVR